MSEECRRAFQASLEFIKEKCGISSPDSVSGVRKWRYKHLPDVPPIKLGDEYTTILGERRTYDRVELHVDTLGNVWYELKNNIGASLGEVVPAES